MIMLLQLFINSTNLVSESYTALLLLHSWFGSIPMAPTVLEMACRCSAFGGLYCWIPDDLFVILAVPSSWILTKIHVEVNPTHPCVCRVSFIVRAYV